MTTLSASSRPVLNPHARIIAYDDSVVVEGRTADYTFRGASARLLTAVRYELYGAADLATLARERHLDASALAAALDVLLEDGTVVDATPIVEGGPAEFLDRYYALCDAWAGDIFAAPFWQTMMSGSASQSLVLGWGMEFYHRVLGADEHNAIAVRHCTDRTLRGWLVDHFGEESGHADIFLDGLVRLGIDRSWVMASEPLPPTQALINYLNTLAAVDTVAYLGCYGVMHSPRVGQTRDNILHQYGRWIEQYGFAAPMIERIRDHALLDIDLGHDSIVFHRLCEHRGSLGCDDIIHVLQAARGTVVAFNNFFAGIYGAHGAADGQPAVSIDRGHSLIHRAPSNPWRIVTS